LSHGAVSGVLEVFSRRVATCSPGCLSSIGNISNNVLHSPLDSPSDKRRILQVFAFRYWKPHGAQFRAALPSIQSVSEQSQEPT
jgi:hypothetical protein